MTNEKMLSNSREEFKKLDNAMAHFIGSYDTLREVARATEDPILRLALCKIADDMSKYIDGMYQQFNRMLGLKEKNKVKK